MSFLFVCLQHQFCMQQRLLKLFKRSFLSSLVFSTLCFQIVESFYARYENEEQEIIQMIDEVLPPRPIHKKDREEFIPLETIVKDKEGIDTEPQQEGSHPEPMVKG